jgi:hypothetical protein
VENGLLMAQSLLRDNFILTAKLDAS